VVRTGQRDVGDRRRRAGRARRPRRSLLRQLPGLAAPGPPGTGAAHRARRRWRRRAPRSIRRVHRAWLGPVAFTDGEADLDIVTAAWTAPGTGAIWRRLVYENPLAQRVSAWTTNGRLGGEVHIAVDLRTGADPAAVRAILDDECQRPIDERAIERAVTRREASAIWGLSGLARRAQLIQRHMLYRELPDGLAGELAHYRAVSVDSIRAAIARWLDPARQVDVETLAGTG
jgi:predicted Zn-dependent peptidase